MWQGGSPRFEASTKVWVLIIDQHRASSSSSATFIHSFIHSLQRADPHRLSVSCEVFFLSFSLNSTCIYISQSEIHSTWCLTLRQKGLNNSVNKAIETNAGDKFCALQTRRSRFLVSGGIVLYRPNISSDREVKNYF